MPQGWTRGSTMGVAWAGSTSSVRLVQVELGANSGPSPNTQNFCPSAFSLRLPLGLGTPPLTWAGAPGYLTVGVRTRLVLCPQLTPPNAVSFPHLLPPTKGRPPLPTPRAVPRANYLLAGGGQLVGLCGQHHQVVDDALQVGDLPQHGQLPVLRKQRVRSAALPAPLQEQASPGLSSPFPTTQGCWGCCRWGMHSLGLVRTSVQTTSVMMS